MTSSNSSGHHLISDYQWDFIKNPRNRADREYHTQDMSAGTKKAPIKGALEQGP